MLFEYFVCRMYVSVELGQGVKIEVTKSILSIDMNSFIYAR